MISYKSKIVFVIFVYLPEEEFISLGKVISFERINIFLSKQNGYNNWEISLIDQCNIHQ